MICVLQFLFSDLILSSLFLGSSKIIEIQINALSFSLATLTTFCRMLEHGNLSTKTKFEKYISFIKEEHIKGHI